MQIEQYIPDGQQNAISQKQLAAVLRCSLRDVRLMVEVARRQGVPICSSCDGGHGGYYMPLTKPEARAYIQMQSSRIQSALAARQAAIDALAYLPD